jgi:hypothetical protein
MRVLTYRRKRRHRGWSGIHRGSGWGMSLSSSRPYRHHPWVEMKRTGGACAAEGRPAGLPGTRPCDAGTGNSVAVFEEAGHFFMYTSKPAPPDSRATHATTIPAMAPVDKALAADVSGCTSRVLSDEYLDKTVTTFDSVEPAERPNMLRKQARKQVKRQRELPYLVRIRDILLATLDRLLPYTQRL